MIYIVPIIHAIERSVVTHPTVVGDETRDARDAARRVRNVIIYNIQYNTTNELNFGKRSSLVAVYAAVKVVKIISV